MHYIRQFQIDCVLDVGANEGQFAQEIRWLGYKHRIESFEPIPQIAVQLRKHSHSDALWNIHEVALGAVEERKTIHLSENLPSSSFLELDDSLETGSVSLRTFGTAEVQVKKLDSLFPSLRQTSKHFYLKVDTQGFERQVIEGAIGCLNQFSIVQLELALIANYRGESVIEEMLLFMRNLGFDPWWIQDGFKNSRSLQLYQVDVFFVNRPLQEASVAIS
jgi:FkbM family methyltransferase